MAQSLKSKNASMEKRIFPPGYLWDEGGTNFAKCTTDSPALRVKNFKNYG